jgi:hypothetical protein
MVDSSKIHAAHYRTEFTHGSYGVVKSFRTLYEQFWQNPDIVIVRSWVASDALYAKQLEPILSQRLEDMEHKKNSLDDKQYEVTEKIDKFCALLVRMHFFNETNMSDDERELWNDIYGTFWFNKVKEREKLRAYINALWHVDALKNIWS